MPEVIINGTAGRLEGRYHHTNANAPVALVLHPHPQFGGTMNNKVVYNMFRIFVDQGFNVLRFNFRGVGRSEGAFDNGEGELNDASAALDWLQGNNANAPHIFVAGFSFGAWIAMHLLMRRPEIDSFIAVSPPADKYDFSFLAPCPVSGLIVQGTEDEIVSHYSVKALAGRMQSKRAIVVNYHEIKGADHFYNQHMDALEGTVKGYVEDFFSPRRKAVNQ